MAAQPVRWRMRESERELEHGVDAVCMIVHPAYVGAVAVEVFNSYLQVAYNVVEPGHRHILAVAVGI